MCLGLVRMWVLIMCGMAESYSCVRITLVLILCVRLDTLFSARCFIHKYSSHLS